MERIDSYGPPLDKHSTARNHMKVNSWVSDGQCDPKTTLLVTEQFVKTSSTSANKVLPAVLINTITFHNIMTQYAPKCCYVERQFTMTEI